MLNEKILKSNVHLARRLFPVDNPDPLDKDGSDIVEYHWKQKITKVGDGENDYIVEEVPVETSRVNRQAYINSFRDDVGIMNILAKVQRSGDVTLFNQTHSVIPEGIQDYTDAPSSIGEALKSIQSGANSFEGLKAIFGDLSFSDLAGLSPDEISNYVNKYIAANTSKPQEGENK